ncbi:hypothetical protein SAMN00808754_1627 [Thermanaeromonas toyohensis ToBE]|uniref:Uncharacterized protein n=2 Tax=Thermanaeromonas TaxID=202949 RepID=A0A1W1VUH0_9FIRM|nr:hypothetical protein SAMN00808754_1627 [Thermanaeromonas toyohensis ToBE]
MCRYGWEDITRITYLTSSIGEPISCLPDSVIPVSESEGAWLQKLEERISLFAYAVQLPDGKRGILLAIEIVNPESECPEDARIAREWGFVTSGDAWRFAETVLKKWREHGLRVFGGYATGPFGRHEIGAFVGFDEPDVLEKCVLADRLASEVDSVTV